MILVIDNYDSFTYNLVQFLGELGDEIIVFRNDKINLTKIKKISPDHIILSPGPGRPENAGICVKLIQTFADSIPILGVCLGHQAIGYAFGGNIISAPSILHGKTSMIHHDNKTIFTDIANPFRATRYHSLVLEKKSIPKDFKISAWTEDDIIMGLRHKKYPIEGVQFHPESFLTDSGKKLLKNFIKNNIPVDILPNLYHR